MLLGIHITDDEAAALRARVGESLPFLRLRAAVAALLAGPNLYDRTKPGMVNSTVADPYSLGHVTAGMSVYHALEPSPTVEAVLLDFLRWIPAQESLMWGQNISLGQFLKGAVLALDAVGEKLGEEERRGILEHLILTCIDNPDPAALPNNHPTGAQPMKRYLEIPGWGFHLPDATVNNWDVVCGQGLLYMARAVEALLPERADDAREWAAIARKRLERVLRLTFSPGGENGEGPGYYSYGTFAVLLMLDCLRRWPGQSTDGLFLDGLYASAEWSRQMHPREVAFGTVNVSDCGLGCSEQPAILHWIAARAGDGGAQALGDALLARAMAGKAPDPEALAYSLLWRDPALTAVEPTGPFARCFGRFGTVAMRTGYTANDRYLLLRCGDYAGAHTHADRGSFLMQAYGELLATDAGCPADRSIPAFKAYHTQTAGHNCALPIGQPQERVIGDTFLQGAITEFRRDRDSIFITADCSQVYPGAGQVLRRLRVMDAGGMLIHDTIEHPGEGIEFLLHTDNRDRQANIDVADGRITIRRPKASLLLFPLLGGTAEDLGAQYQDSDPEGQRALSIRIHGGEMLTLLVPVRVGEEDTVQVEAIGARRWRVSCPEGMTEVGV